jgi:chorismate synthase
VRGLPVGLGGFSQWYHRLDGRLAQALMSIHSVKGVEIGQGFGGAALRGSQFQDEIFYDPKKEKTKKGFYRTTNNAGGLEGGITNGEDIIVRVANKPISTLNRPLQTVNVETKKPAEAMVERTDNCVVPALAVVCEAVIALTLAEVFLQKFSADNLAEIERNYQSFLDTAY